MSTQPTFPDLTKMSELINAQASATIDLLNAQMTEASTTLSLPALPVLPKFVLPTLPKPPEGAAMPMGMFGTKTQKKKAEETITLPKPTPGVEEIVA